MKHWPWVYETVGSVDPKWNGNSLHIALFDLFLFVDRLRFSLSLLASEEMRMGHDHTSCGIIL